MIQQIIYIFKEIIIYIFNKIIIYTFNEKIIYIFNKKIIYIFNEIIIYVVNERIIFIQRIIYMFKKLFTYSSKKLFSFNRLIYLFNEWIEVFLSLNISSTKYKLENWNLVTISSGFTKGAWLSPHGSGWMWVICKQ